MLEEGQRRHPVWNEDPNPREISKVVKGRENSQRKSNDYCHDSWTKPRIPKQQASKRKGRAGWVWAAIHAESHPHLVVGAVVIVGL